MPIHLSIGSFVIFCNCVLWEDVITSAKKVMFFPALFCCCCFFLVLFVCLLTKLQKNFLVSEEMVRFWARSEDLFLSGKNPPTHIFNKIMLLFQNKRAKASVDLDCALAEVCAL